MSGEVRRATADDADALASLWLEWGQEYESMDPLLFRVPSENGLGEWFGRQIAETSSDELWLVGERGGEVLAFEQAGIWRPGEDADRSLVVDDAMTTLKVSLLVVSPPARRSGLGTALTSEAQRWASERGAERAVVVAMSDSPTAVPFYRSQGFRPFTTGLWKPLDA